MAETKHIPVLLQQVIDCLDLSHGEIVVDATINGGGHSKALCDRFGNTIRIIGIDADSGAIRRAEEKFQNLECNVTLIRENFRNIDVVLDNLGVEYVDAILFDLGWSMDQMEYANRGFSFNRDEPLVMTFSEKPSDDAITAYDIVNTWDEEHITTIIKHYGGEQFARRIAHAIVTEREEKPIETTKMLVDVIDSAVPRWYRNRRVHSATKTFQALRITVNDEIDAIRDGIRKGFARLTANGRIVVITFHSLEDRIIKQEFKEMEKQGLGKRSKPAFIKPTYEEVKQNPRARSATLRTFIKN